MKPLLVPAPIAKLDFGSSEFGWVPVRVAVPVLLHFVGLVLTVILAPILPILLVALPSGPVILPVASTIPQVLGCYSDPPNSVLAREL